jgi:phage FluMu gp28-like protein
LTTDGALALVLSPTLRQSQEFARTVVDADRAIGRPVPVVRDSATGIEWANGSRMLSLPDNQRGVVGFSPTMIVIDEASRVSDALYKSLRPMLGLGAELCLLSTPFGRLGFFWEIWDDPNRLNLFRWWKVTADHCPRLSPEFLAEERIELGNRWFQQEYYCNFTEAIGAVFTQAMIEAAFVSGIEPLFPIEDPPS